MKRNSAVAALVEGTIQREELTAALTGLGDMERLLGRIVYGTAGGRDLTSLRSAIERLPAIREQLEPFSGGRLAELREELDDLAEIGRRIGETICDDPPFSVREGGLHPGRLRPGGGPPAPHHERRQGRPGGDRGQGEGAHPASAR